MNKTWLITGCSEGGLGAGIAKAVLRRGYNAVVTARDLGKVQSIVKDYPDTALAVALDVTKPDSIAQAVDAARARFGQIDVLVNNAGYCYRSSVEEADRGGVDAMYETNFFGPVALIQAVLPEMRARHSGAIVNISSIGAVRTGAASGYYASTKAALELMSEGLAAECRPLGIKVLIVEPGAFRTHFYDSSLKGAALTIGDYQDTAWKRSPQNAVNQRNQPGDPDKAGDVLIDVLERDDAPQRLLLGNDAVKAVRATLEGRLRELEAWKEYSVRTDM
ncbi:MAG: SDR family NAD(P)-dependent oxidoreductase [Clostridiales bacterium]|nr:SDR family NAD(P)-dependent oxidoreductase [Clostridiales bacterium]